MTAAAEAPTRPMVRAERVCKDFGALTVLKGVTLEVERGQVLCIVGPSGSGKSTFLRCINHLEQVTAGRLYVDGDLIGYRERGDKLHEMPPREAEGGQTAASREALETFIKSAKAKLWIQHDQVNWDQLKKAPQYYE